MYRIASVVLIALALIACGGGDDNDDPSSSGSAPTATVASAEATSGGSTPAETTPAQSMPAAPTPTESTDENTESIDGAPTHASSDFPDVQVPLDAGSSGEVGSQDPDPFAATDSRDENSRVKVTINEVLDPAEIEGTLITPEPGNRWFAINITVEATGSEVANTGIWTLMTTDGIEYEQAITLGSVPDITYGSIEAGTTEDGLVVFEIPEDASVAWILMSPTIFVGENLVFVN